MYRTSSPFLKYFKKNSQYFPSGFLYQLPKFLISSICHSRDITALKMKFAINNFRH